jgi:hypothetical protein
MFQRILFGTAISPLLVFGILGQPAPIIAQTPSPSQAIEESDSVSPGVILDYLNMIAS